MEKIKIGFCCFFLHRDIMTMCRLLFNLIYMPNTLDDLKKIKKLDKSKATKSIEFLYAQVRQVLDDARLIKIPREYSRINKVVINGMGGSNLGAGIFKSVFGKELKVPVNIVAGYEVPGYVDANTLCVLSSYSGGTEETLSVYKELKKRKAKILGISSAKNGPLQKLMMKDNIPGYLFNDINNPTKSPRMGVGYSAFGMMILLAKAGLFSMNVPEIKRMIGDLELWDRELRPEVKANMNIAKKLARELYNKQVIIVGAEFLLGNLRALRNQFCETGKNFASYLVIPDMNHYAMEGLAHPASNKKDLVFFFFNSALYHPRVQRRSGLTEEVIKKNKIKAVKYKLRGRTKLEQAFEMLQLGSWVTFYLAMLNRVDPSPNLWVDWFKSKLK